MNRALTCALVLSLGACCFAQDLTPDEAVLPPHQWNTVTVQVEGMT